MTFSVLNFMNLTKLKKTFKFNVKDLCDYIYDYLENELLIYKYYKT